MRIHLSIIGEVRAIVSLLQGAHKYNLTYKSISRESKATSVHNLGQGLFTIRNLSSSCCTCALEIAQSGGLCSVKAKRTGSSEARCFISHALCRAALTMLPGSAALCEKSKRRRRVGREPILRRLGTVHGHWCCWIDVAPDVNKNGEGSGSNMPRYLCLTSEHLYATIGIL